MRGATARRKLRRSYCRRFGMRAGVLLSGIPSIPGQKEVKKMAGEVRGSSSSDLLATEG